MVCSHLPFDGLWSKVSIMDDYHDVSKSLTKLKTMKEMARNEAIDYVKISIKPSVDHCEKVANL